VSIFFRCHNIVAHNPMVLRGDEPLSTGSSPAPVFCASDGTPFGPALKAKHFLLDPTLVTFNHGSFGAIPRVVLEAQQHLVLQQEKHLDRWFRQTYFGLIDVVRVALAKLVNCPEADLVLVENASAAVNSILRSWKFGPKDSVLMLSTAYPMVVHTADWLVAEYGVHKVVVDVTFPLRETKSLINRVGTALMDAASAGFPVALCVFSHISSVPAIVEPVKELTAVAHAHGARVLVDGAHAPGQIDIDVAAIGCDFYCGNCHKWLFAPKGTAFLVVGAASQSALFPQPTAISSSGKPDFPGRYLYTGTRDYTAFAAVTAALQFCEFLGPERICQYNSRLAAEGGALCATMWNTDFIVAPELCGFMVNVGLPVATAAAMETLQRTLDVDHNVYIVCSEVRDTSGRSMFFTRLSAQVYLDLNDFRMLAELVLELVGAPSPSAHTQKSGLLGP